MACIAFGINLPFIGRGLLRYSSLFICCFAFCGCMVKPIDTNIVINQAGIIDRHYALDHSKTFKVLVLGSEQSRFFEFINFLSDEKRYRDFMAEFEPKIKNYSLIFFTEPSKLANDPNDNAILSYKVFLARNELSKQQADRLKNEYKAADHQEFLVVEFKLYGEALNGRAEQYANLKPLKTPLKATITHDPRRLSAIGEVMTLMTAPIWIFGLKI